MTYNEINKKRLTFERKFYPMIRKSLRGMLLQIIEFMDFAQSLNEDLVNLIVSTDKLKETFVKLYTNTGKSFAHMTYTNLARMKNTEPAWDEMMRDYAETMAGSKVVTITGTQKEMFLKLFQEISAEAFEQGYGVEKTASYLKRELLKRGVEYQKWQARRIAQTEILGASNRAQSFAATEINKIIRIKKVWSTGGLSKTERHTAIPELNTGQAIELDQPFVFLNQNGKLTEMMEPGDSSRGAGAEDVVNCKCIIQHVVA